MTKFNKRHTTKFCVVDLMVTTLESGSTAIFALSVHQKLILF